MEAARNGWLGKIYMVRGTINTLIQDAGRKDLARFKGGQMFELGAHLVDAVVRLMGKPADVAPFLREHGPQRDGLKDNTVAVFAYERALAMVQSAALHPGAFAHRAFEILGTNGTAVLRPIEPPSLQIDLASAAGPYKAGTNKVAMPAYRRYVEDFANFAAAIRGAATLPVKLQDELIVHEALLAASEML
jgi:predicted dehydrogenase